MHRARRLRPALHQVQAMLSQIIHMHTTTLSDGNHQERVRARARPLVTHQLPLEQSVEAIKLLTERRAYGRILVIPKLNP